MSAAAWVMVVIAFGGLFLVALSVVRAGWRLFGNNEPLEPGGSLGRQFFGRNKQRQPD
jgi:hypothetical protein